MTQYWLVVGTQRNWRFSFDNSKIWGLKDFRESAALWNLLQEGDKLLIYVSKPVSGVVGIATVTTKFRQTQPLWPEETRRGSVIWPLRFEFDVEYCLSPSLWESHSYREANLQLITRMVFQCVPSKVTQEVRRHFRLAAEQPRATAATDAAAAFEVRSPIIGHDLAKKLLCDIGRTQGFLAEEEYPIESARLDVVWRRVERSVPTYAFEVQVGGDVYHALAKLKHAYDLWNSHIFLAGQLDARAKFEEVISGSFNEVRERVGFLELAAIEELHRRKTSYLQLEKQLRLKV